jgi:hypothetical protein
MTIALFLSMLSLILSTILFFAVSFFLNRYLEDWGLDKGRTRTLLVLFIASMISYGAISLVDHFTGETSLLDKAIELPQAQIR